MLTKAYGGTRIGAQELDGKLLEDVEGALWTEAMIARARVEPRRPQAAREDFDRIVVGVDPPGGDSDHCDACGIVVATSARPGHTSGSRRLAALGAAKATVGVMGGLQVARARWVHAQHSSFHHHITT